MSYTLRVHHREAEPYTDLYDAADVEEACRQECSTEVGDAPSEYVDLDDLPERADDDSNLRELEDLIAERYDRATEELTARMFRAVWTDPPGEFRMPYSRVRYSLTVEEPDGDE